MMLVDGWGERQGKGLNYNLTIAFPLNAVTPKARIRASVSGILVQQQSFSSR